MRRRTAQIAANLRRAVTETLARGVNDPRVQGLVTVTEVELSEDLKRATVRVTVFPESKESVTMHGLKAATKTIRRRVADLVRIREMPTLEFVVDRGLKEQAKVIELLAKAKAESGPAFGAEDAGDGPGEEQDA